MRQPLECVDREWAEARNVSGLSSGEGVIWAVHDALEEQEPIRDKTKRVTDYQTVVTDPGITDKRLMVVEPEFASALRVAERDGNTLSAVLRQAWDTGTLRVLTRNKPAKATGSHISILGHITKDELLKYLTTTEAANGFANRFMWVCVQRSKLLPEGGNLAQVNFVPIIRKLQEALKFAGGAGEMTRDDEAREMWAEVYPHLTGDRSGMFGSVTSRAEAITLRLSCLYALLDASSIINSRHLAAAVEVWRYCEDSARFIFGDSLGDDTADRILQALRRTSEGLTRTDISSLFDRTKSADQISIALNRLSTMRLAHSTTESTKGRPTERWFAGAQPAHGMM
jgi:hypothetical protein